MTTVLAPAPAPDRRRARQLVRPLAAREMRRFVLNPIFLFAVVMTAWTTSTPSAAGGAIDSVNPYTAVFLGGLSSC